MYGVGRLRARKRYLPVRELPETHRGQPVLGISHSHSTMCSHRYPGAFWGVYSRKVALALTYNNKCFLWSF